MSTNRQIATIMVLCELIYNYDMYNNNYLQLCTLNQREIVPIEN